MTTSTTSGPALARFAAADPSRYDAGDLRHPGAQVRMRQLLAREGLAIFNGARSRAEVLMAAGTMMTVLPHPDSGPDGITAITDLGAAGEHPGAAGFSRRQLAAHTDRSGVPAPPALLMTVCARPAHAGGARTLTDGQAVHAELAVTSPQVLAALTRPRSVLFGGAGGYLGAVLTAIPATTASPARLHLRLRLDDLVTFAPDLLTHLPVLRAVIARRTITMPLGAGQGYILDNHRWLHAREQFTGTRTLYRVLGDPLSRLGLHPGIPQHDRERGQQQAVPWRARS
jgi:hypothetical protein